MLSLAAAVTVVIFAGLALLVAATVGAWVLAPRIAALAGAGADRWWLGRWAQAGAVLLVLTPFLLLSPAPLWPGIGLGLTAAVLACLVDAASHRLPDVLTLRAGGIAVAALAGGAWFAAGWPGVAAVAVGAGVSGGVLLLLALVYPAGMGLGDVKLAALLGALVGAVAGAVAGDSAGAVLGGAAWAGVGLLLAAFVLGGLASLVLLGLRRVGRRDPIPFGPFLLLGTLVTLAVVLAAPAGP